MNAWGLTAEPSGLRTVGLLAADCGGSGTIEVEEGPPGLDWCGGNAAAPSWALDTMMRSLGCNWVKGFLYVRVEEIEIEGWRERDGRGTRASIRSDNPNIPWL
jgi:hypothetical protein